MSYALITGASSGLGSDFARLFARDGHHLILVARRKDRMETLAKEIQQQFPKIQIEIIAMDLGIPGAGQLLFDQVHNRGLEVQFLINNAGFGSNGNFSRLDLKKELQMIDLNMRVLVELTHLFLQPMLRKKSGHILNVGSTAGFQPGPFMATYYASKAFVNSFSKALSLELHGTGVSCTLLAPGATATEFAQSASVEESRLFKHQMLTSSMKVSRDGYKATLKGRTAITSGVMNNISVFFVRFLPTMWVARVAAYLNSRY